MNTGISKTVIDEIIHIAKQQGIKKVLLFGSRARGDFRRTSDIDLAVFGGNVARFVADIQEETSTLLMFDVVDLGASIQKELLQSIEKEGVIIYEKV